MKVLIVDDVKGWRDYNSSIVKSMFAGVNQGVNQGVNIDTAESAREGYDKVLENNTQPYDIILTDLQMESDFEPLYAGEWLVERIKEMKNYYKTKIVIISATYNIDIIADKYSVDYIRKSTARSFPDSYDFLKST